MMVSKRMPRTREYRGIQPGSVAIMAKNPKSKPADWLTMKGGVDAERVRDLEMQVKEQKKQDLRTDFEFINQRRVLFGNIKNKVKTMAQATEYNLECRRERLRALLAEEDEQYFREMGEREETVLERQAKMRERAKFLKDKRETERLEFVQDKYDQQFRSQCEELRSTLTKRHQDQVCLDRLEQLRQRDQIAQEKKAYEDMYAKLWEQDMLEKAAREEREAQGLHERNKGALEVLHKQMAALEAQKEEARQLKEEEAQLLKEQTALWKLEDEKALEEKHQKQQETRHMLDRSLVSKARRKAKEEQELLAFDLKMLEQLLEESRNEAMETTQRKRELREEDQRYREYLRKLMEQEKAREKEIEHLIHQEVEAAWAKRIEQWRNERKARELILQDVMAGRAKQLQERLLENERRQMEAAKEKEDLQKCIEENHMLDAQEATKRWQGRVQYQHDLVDQMAFNTKLWDAERAMDEGEFMKAQQAEREFQDRIKQVLDNPTLDKLHPMRKAMLNKDH